MRISPLRKVDLTPPTSHKAGGANGDGANDSADLLLLIGNYNTLGDS